jgi:hypothetical protein
MGRESGFAGGCGSEERERGMLQEEMWMCETIERANSALVAPGRRGPGRLLRRSARSECGWLERPDCRSGRGLSDSWRVRPDCLGPWTHAQARDYQCRVGRKEPSKGCWALGVEL